jgi:hypothetical protein
LRRLLVLPPALIDELAQLPQLIGSEKGATSTNRDYEVGLDNVSPFDRKCAQPPFRACVRHAVSAPIVAHGEQIERLSP